MKKNQENTNWGRNTITFPNVYKPKNIHEIKKQIKLTKNFAIQGNKRSFGDVALNQVNIISSNKLNEIISFNNKKGEVEVESGLLISDLLEKIVPHGWFVPVTPGSKYVSIGGMVANNIIGKNTKKNQIKYYIKKIKLITPQNKTVNCTPKLNKKLFDLTIGGFGLTGFMYSITLKLTKIYSENIDQKIIEFKTYEQFYNITKKNKYYDYSVSWIDWFDKNNIVGLYYLGNKSKNLIKKVDQHPLIKKFDLIFFIILRITYTNYYFPKIINLIFRNYKKFFYKKTCHFNEFFYPQDNVPLWNKIYGSKGFVQVQFLIPSKKFKEILSEISEFMKNNKVFSPFIILKKFEEKGKYMNFYGSGYSLSFDFPINKKYNILSEFLNKLFKKHHLKVNFTKDLITMKNNANNYKNFNKFKSEISKINRNKKINSLFSNRLSI